MGYVISLTLVLAALWLAVSGVYKLLILLLGAGSIALVVWLSRRMEVVGTEHNPVLFSWRLPVYWAWLIGQIVLANLNVARLVFSPKHIRPGIVRVPVDHKAAVSKVTFANSVTLTPGTVSLLLTDDELVTHALDRKSADGLVDGEMSRKVLWLERSKS